MVVVAKPLTSLDFHAKPSLEFIENGPEKRKYPMSRTSLGKNAFLMCGQRRMDRFDDRKGTVT